MNVLHFTTPLTREPVQSPTAEGSVSPVTALTECQLGEVIAARPRFLSPRFASD